MRVKSEAGGGGWNSAVGSGAVKPEIGDMLPQSANRIEIVRMAICADTPDCEPGRIW